MWAIWVISLGFMPVLRCEFAFCQELDWESVRLIRENSFVNFIQFIKKLFSNNNTFIHIIRL